MKKGFCFVLFCFVLFCFVEGQNTWNVKLPYSSGYPLCPLGQLIMAQDGGYIVLIGKSELGGQRIQTVYKYNKNGDLVWEKNDNFGVYPPPPPGINLAGGPSPTGIIQLANSDLVLIGTLVKENNNSSSNGTYFHRMSSEGDSILFWEHEEEYRGMYSFQQSNDMFYAHAKTDSFHLIASININDGSINDIPLYNIGSISSYLNIGADFFIKRNLSGVFHLEKYNYNNVFIDDVILPFIHFYTKSYDNNLIIYTKDDFMKLSSDLDTLWHYPATHIEFENFSQEVCEIKSTSDGGMLIVGSAGPVNLDWANHLSYIIKLDELGVEEWRYLYARQYMQLNVILHIEEVEDGYVFLGGDQLTESIWLVKINKEGLFTTATEEPEGLTKEENFLDLYPNPLNNELTMIAENPIDGNISIYNVQGQVIYQEKVKSNNSYNLNLAQLSSGIYFLRYFDQKLNKIETHKIVKN